MLLLRVVKQLSLEANFRPEEHLYSQSGKVSLLILLFLEFISWKSIVLFFDK